MKPVAQVPSPHVCGFLSEPTPLRTLDEIRADIAKLEKETEGLLAEIVGEGPNRV